MKNTKVELIKTPKEAKAYSKSIITLKIDIRGHSFIKSALHFMQGKAEQPLRGMELQGKEAQKAENIQEICLERTYS